MKNIDDYMCNYIPLVCVCMCVADSLHLIKLEMGLERTETRMHEVRGYTLIMTSPSRGLVNVDFFSLSHHYRRKTEVSAFGKYFNYHHTHQCVE